MTGYRKKNIEWLITQFRNAIDEAKNKDRFRNLYPFYKFPDDCCGHACDLLGQYLQEHGVMTSQMKGTCKYDENWHHVWLLTGNRMVIDITEDQFIGKLVTEDQVEKVHIGSEGIVQRLFCMSRVSQENTIFTDSNKFNGFGGIPDAYQKRLIDLYEIICEEL